MNHQKVYDNIIEKARSENRKKLKKINPSYVYYNNHHIYPRCMGGGNEKENMQLVTAKEHYICHKLLTYIYPKHRGIVYAFFRMSTSKKYGHISSSRDYSYTKELLNLIPISEETKRKIGVKSSQRTHSSETRKKISINTIKKLKEPDVKNKMCAASQGRDPWNKNNPGCFSNKSIMKMSNSHIGLVSGMKDKHHKKESNEKNRKAHLGKSPNRDNTIYSSVMSKINKQKKYCIHCKKEYNPGNYGRYHGEKCKNKKI